MAGAVGVAGCQGGGGGDGSSPDTDGETTYGITVENGLSVDDFEGTSELSGPEPAELSLRVNGLTNDETYFQRTVKVETGATRTFEEAFTVSPDGPTYAMNAQLTPFVGGGLSRQFNRKAGLTFAPDERPSRNPIEVRLVSIDSQEGLYPEVSIVGQG